MYDAIKVEKFLENVCKENVRKMLERWDKIEDIVEITGLTKKEIERIKDEE